MAQRRMFSKTITNSSQFLKMSPTARLLYYDLGMNADDDGYVEWFMVIRMTGAVEQDLKVLEANNFIKIFDSLVLWLKDWNENNYIQKDRYTPSKYLTVYPLLSVDSPRVDTECIQDVSKTDTQVRLGKVRLGEVKTTTSIKMDEEDFTDFWKAYPRHDVKATTKVKFLKLDKSLLPVLLMAIETQKESEQWQKDNGQFIPQPITWINQKRWEDELNEPKTDIYQKAIKILGAIKYGTPTYDKKVWRGIDLASIQVALDSFYPDQMDLLPNGTSQVLSNLDEIKKHLTI